MNVIKTCTTVAALALSLAASCVMAQSGGTSGSSGYGSSGGSRSNSSGYDSDLGSGSGSTSSGTAPSSGTSSTSGQSGRNSSSDSYLDTMPPTGAGTTTTDTAPSSINPDKGPHGATKLNKSNKTKARHKRRSGDTDPRDPHQVNGAMDGEGTSGTPSR